IVRKEPVVRRLEREARGREHGFMTGAADLKKDLALVLELDFLVVQLARQQHAAVDGEQILARESVENLCFWPVENGLHAVPNYSIGTRWYMLHLMSTQTVRLHRWDEIALEKVTEMLSRKV